jgi:site-specific DNA recombinase
MHIDLPDGTLAVQQRCAIYTRKSSERGLDLPVNSLETQRDICSAYIKCQGHRHWIELPHQYDDGGYSGAHLTRPALQRLLSDIEAGRLDLVVVYKIDRLTRSLTDFIRLIDAFRTFGVGFVSVTQAFDTSDSMGRLVLNVLLTFAQFERELMGERLSDKIHSMKSRGKFAGGIPPFGYRKGKKGLEIEPAEAGWVRRIFREYPSAQSGNQLMKQLRCEGFISRRFTSKVGNVLGGNPMSTGHLNRILGNPIYLGFQVSRGEWYKAEHEPIITRAEWDLAQLAKRNRFPVASRKDPSRNILLGLLYDEQGRRLKLDMCRPHGTRHVARYYYSERTRWATREQIKRVRVDADQAEQFVQTTLQAFLNNRPDMGAAIMSIGTYTPETKRLLKNGTLAISRINRMDRLCLRRLFEALISRAEVTRTEIRLFVSCYELARFLAWDGEGLFERSRTAPTRTADRVHLVRAPAHLVREHRRFSLPIRQRLPGGKPNPKLVALLERAAATRQLVLQNRDVTPEDLARQRRMGPSYFARMLRLNYLAPDIQAAIVDGTQPPDLTPKKLIFSLLPLDWEQQRQMLGFG